MGFFSRKKKETEQPSKEVAVKTPSPDKVNLLKTRVNLFKEVVAKRPIGIDKARVALVLDYSGSMRGLYNRGIVQDIVARVLPVGVTFDDNEAIDLFAFHNDAFDIGEVTPAKFHNIIEKKITSKFRMGGTNYAPIIEMVTRKYTQEKGDPAYVMFIVDGDCWDKPKAKEAIIEASKSGIFFQFIGIGSADMNFLEELDEMDGRAVDNANFFRVVNIVAMNDDELYNKLMTEFPDWVIAAKALNII